MAKYGNSRGGNTGKKYIKLTGDEVAHPLHAHYARRFLDWYAANMVALRQTLIYEKMYDEDVAVDAALIIHDAIALKGLKVREPKWYYLRTYHTARLQKLKADAISVQRHLQIDDAHVITEEPPVDWHGAVAQFDAEVMDYVRGQFDRKHVSVFEIYVALAGPTFGVTKLARLLGYPESHVEDWIREIRKDLVTRYGARKDFLLS